MPPTQTKLKDRVSELIREVPVDGISENMLYYALNHQDWEVTRKEVERTATSLVNEGRLTVTGEINGYRRFSISDDKG